MLFVNNHIQLTVGLLSGTTQEVMRSAFIESEFRHMKITHNFSQVLMDWELN